MNYKQLLGRSGTQRKLRNDTLHQYIVKTLTGGNLRLCVQLPQGTKEEEWLAVNVNVDL
ncbi:hypothetical protein SmJEL517_g03452 [Synchytrium microbalum]|uniref:Uncharacterized protein n=1 Tax=Synchytrium microbalum TaxID=1806994 RepID=A0A507C316_9FUNG|nr:uncharacterized protein SmJEL517_g03452 [Synchytrium microbalum]TPX33758.1 hypothetical protein SmJEL517_g03452 [Synchytrium microbalum]